MDLLSTTGFFELQNPNTIQMSQDIEMSDDQYVQIQPGLVSLDAETYTISRNDDSEDIVMDVDSKNEGIAYFSEQEIPEKTLQSEVETRQRPLTTEQMEEEPGFIGKCFSKLGFPGSNKGERINSTVITLLQSLFSDKYGCQSSWSVDFPWANDFSQSLLKRVFDLIITIEDKDLREIYRRNGDASYVFSTETTVNRILVHGKPRFGKTSLCSYLASRWADQDKEVMNFKLCLFFHLSDLVLPEFGISELIVEKLTNLLSNRSYTPEVVQTALKGESKNIAVLLDGYDELHQKAKLRVKEFLRSDSLFINSTIIVTSRPETDDRFLEIFQQHVYIQEFSTDRLAALLYTTRTIESFMTNFFKTFNKNSSVEYLSDLSPFFLYHFWNAIKYGYLESIHKANLFLVLENVFCLIVQHSCRRSGKDMILDIDAHFLKLGYLFFQALYKQQFYFTETFLKNILGDEGFEIIINCNIFHEHRHAQVRYWTASSKLFIVFFTTKYLRHLWSKQSNNMKAAFVKNVLCFGDSTGDYIFGKSAEPRLYFVGVLAEIVLDFGNQFLLEDATIEMYYDVERTEQSNAFDSVNLLVRLGERHLPRFYYASTCITQVDEHYTRVFSKVLNALSVDGSVDYAFYHNTMEQKDFLKIIVSSSENMGPDLHCVCRANAEGIIDRVNVDFILEKLDGFCDFMCELLHISRYDVIGESKELLYGEFVYRLVFALFNKRSRFRRAIVSCCGGNNEENVKRMTSFTICSNSETGDCGIDVSGKFAHSSIVRCGTLFVGDEISQFDKFISSEANDAFESALAPTISIDLFCC